MQSEICNLKSGIWNMKSLFAFLRFACCCFLFAATFCNLPFVLCSLHLCCLLSAPCFLLGVSFMCVSCSLLFVFTSWSLPFIANRFFLCFLLLLRIFIFVFCSLLLLFTFVVHSFVLFGFLFVSSCLRFRFLRSLLL